MRYLPSIALAILLVLAGCNSPLIAGKDPRHITVTPADVPPNSDRGTLAPGLTQTDIVRPKSLIDAHREVLENRSVTVEQTTRSVAANETILTQVAGTDRYGPNRTSYNLTTNVTETRSVDSSGIDRIAEWSDGETQYRMVKWNNTTTYRPAYPTLQITHQIHSILSIFNKTDVVEVENLSTDNGLHRYGVRGKLWFPNSRKTSDERVMRTTGDVLAVIDERGFVRKYRSEIRYQQNNSTIRIVQTIHYSNLGTTTIDRPVWVDTAINATETTNENRYQWSMKNNTSSKTALSQ